MKNRNPIIYLICGKSEQGKSTLCNYIEKQYINENVVITPCAKYLKYYANDITKENNKNNKHRHLLQQLGNLIRIELNKKDMLINRLIEDINVYSFYSNIIIIPDIRLKYEIDKIKEKFNNVIVIKVIRSNHISSLTEDELKDITETDLENYQDYDYLVTNHNIKELEEQAIQIYEEVSKDAKNKQ